MRIGSACIALLSVLTTPAWADPPSTEIPTHVVRDIRRLVEPSEVIVIGSVLSAPENGKVALKVEQTVTGTLPLEIELATDGIYEPDYEVGSKLLLSLRKQKAKNRWVVTGAYERVFENNVREYTLEAFLSVVTKEHARIQRERRSLAAVPNASFMPPTVANASESSH